MYDIRTEKPQQIENIRFADTSGEDDDKACILSKEMSDAGALITDEEADMTLLVACKNDAENLIKALGKAIELGWFDYTLKRGSTEDV